MISVSIAVFALLLMGAWAYLWRRLVVPKIHGHLAISSHSVRFGLGCELIVTMENHSKLPAPFVRCDIHMPDGLVLDESKITDATLRYQTLRLGLSLRPRESVTARIPVIGTARGRYRIHSIELQLSDGLTPGQIRTSIPGEVELTVHPRMIHERKAQHQAPMVLGPMGTDRKLFPTSLDWIDMRPYQPGDSVRDISWTISARHEQPVVLVRSLSVEYQYIVVLNIQRESEAWGSNAYQAEAIYEEAYALCRTLLRKESVLTILCNSVWPNERRTFVHELVTARGPLNPKISARIGHALGYLPTFAHCSLSALLDEILASKLSPTHVIVLTGYEDEEIRNQYRRLERYGHVVTSQMVTPSERDDEANEKVQSEPQHTQTYEQVGAKVTAGGVVQ